MSSSVSASAGLAPSRAKMRGPRRAALPPPAVSKRHQAAPLAEQRLRLLVGHAEVTPMGGDISVVSRRRLVLFVRLGEESAAGRNHVLRQRQAWLDLAPELFCDADFSRA